MSFVRKLFGRTNYPDPLLERAESLVQGARINAEGMYNPLLERFPFLRHVDIDHWNFILTVASVFMAATRLNNLRLSDDREDKLMEVVTTRLDKWKPDGSHGFEDCKVMFETEFDRLTRAGHESRFVASDAVGVWIVLNLLGRPPQTDSECTLVRAVGGMVTIAFFDWWDK